MDISINFNSNIEYSLRDRLWKMLQLQVIDIGDNIPKA